MKRPKRIIGLVLLMLIAMFLPGCIVASDGNGAWVAVRGDVNLVPTRVATSSNGNVLGFTGGGSGGDIEITRVEAQNPGAIKVGGIEISGTHTDSKSEDWFGILGVGRIAAMSKAVGDMFNWGNNRISSDASVDKARINSGAKIESSRINAEAKVMRQQIR